MSKRVSSCWGDHTFISNPEFRDVEASLSLVPKIPSDSDSPILGSWGVGRTQGPMLFNVLETLYFPFWWISSFYSALTAFQACLCVCVWVCTPQTGTQVCTSDSEDFACRLPHVVGCSLAPRGRAQGQCRPRTSLRSGCSLSHSCRGAPWNTLARWPVLVLGWYVKHVQQINFKVWGHLFGEKMETG